MVLETLENAGLGPSSPAFWLLLAVFLAGALVLVYALRASRLSRRLRADLEQTRIALAAAESKAGEVEPLKFALEAERQIKARLENEAAANSVRLAEREAALADLKMRMEVDFQAAASKMLENAHQSFLDRAKETFERHQEASGAEADKRRKAIDDLIKPMRETLGRYEVGLAEMRADQHKSRGELLGRIGDLAKSAGEVRQEAQKLSTALRAGPKTRGRWGEEQLRNVVEIAGMSAYVDFVEQKSVDDRDGRKQPDMIVNLPGGRKIAVDSKVSINAYLDAVEAESEAVRVQNINRHADDLWAHVKALSAKDYAASMRDALDIVIMFVPGENYFAAAMETRPQLFQDAFDRKILIATPTTLVAMLKAASFNWRQERAAENAVAVARMAKDLYDSLRVMSGNLEGLGKALEGAIGKYNSAVGGFEQRVLSRARRFAEYELPGIDADIAELTPIEGAPRALRDDRKLDGDTGGKDTEAA